MKVCEGKKKSNFMPVIKSIKFGLNKLNNKISFDWMQGLGNEDEEGLTCTTYELFPDQLEIASIDVYYSEVLGINYMEINFASDFQSPTE